MQLTVAIAEIENQLAVARMNLHEYFVANTRISCIMMLQSHYLWILRSMELAAKTAWLDSIGKTEAKNPWRL